MKINQQLLETSFTLPNLNIISHLTPGSVPFYFKDYNKNTLVVTFGDSWTWGSDLTPQPNDEYRCANVYGHQLAQKLDADFLNLAVPGAGNQYIHQLFCEFAKIAKHLEYQRIVAVITFTEVGRDFNGWFDQQLDYRSWLDNNIKESSNYTELIKWLNSRLCESIAEHLAEIPNLDLYVASNFVDPIGLEPLAKYQLPATWLDIYSGVQDHQCFFVSAYIFDKLNTVFDLHWDLDRMLYMTWAEPQMSNSSQRKLVLGNELEYRNYHPTVEGHTAWANYVARAIKERHASS